VVSRAGGDDGVDGSRPLDLDAHLSPTFAIAGSGGVPSEITSPGSNV
jgi:hypothetical protein